MGIVGLVKPKQLASRLGHTVANPASRTTNMSLGSCSGGSFVNGSFGCIRKKAVHSAP